MKTFIVVLIFLLVPTMALALPKIIVLSWDEESGWAESNVLTVWNILDSDVCKNTSISNCTKTDKYANWLYEHVMKNSKGYRVKITWPYENKLGESTKTYKFDKITEVHMFIWLFMGYGWRGPMF